MSAPASGPPDLLRVDRAVLVVVDLQEKLLPAIAEKERVLRNTVLLLRAARELGLPVVLTTQYQKGLGPAVPEVRREARGVEPVDSYRWLLGTLTFTGAEETAPPTSVQVTVTV